MRRRDFLKTLGASGTAVAAFSCADREAAERSAADGTDADVDLKWDKAPCRFCGTGCGVEVGVKDGKVMSVRGDEANPVNKGLLCVKGYHLPGFLYGEDRLRHPLKRRDDGEFELLGPATRDEHDAWSRIERAGRVARSDFASHFDGSGLREGVAAILRRRLVFETAAGDLVALSRLVHH